MLKTLCRSKFISLFFSLSRSRRKLRFCTFFRFMLAHAFVCFICFACCSNNYNETLMPKVKFGKTEWKRKTTSRIHVWTHAVTKETEEEEKKKTKVVIRFQSKQQENHNWRYLLLSTMPEKDLEAVIKWVYKFTVALLFVRPKKNRIMLIVFVLFCLAHIQMLYWSHSFFFKLYTIIASCPRQNVRSKENSHEKY